MMKLKKLLSFTAAAVMTVTALMSSMSVSASNVATGECGDNVTWSLNSEGVLTISGTGPMYGSDSRLYYTSYKGWTYSAYADQIKEVVIEEGVTSLGTYAFGWVITEDYGLRTEDVAYPNLTKITLPSTIERIGQGAFYSTVIENLTVPENVKTIEPYAYTLSKIENVTINDGVYLWAGSFYNCPNLKEVTVGADITYGHGAGWAGSGENHSEDIFSYCTALEKVTILGSGTVKQRFTTIENGLPNTMFVGCTSLSEVIIKCTDLEYVGKVNEGSLNTETFPANGGSGIQYDINITYYLLKDSTTEATLKAAGYLTDENVVYLADIEALKEVIQEAEEIDITKYTEETASVLTSAIENAKAVLENPDALQEDSDNAIEALNNAISGLEEKPAPTEPSSDNPSKNPSEKPSENPSNPTSAKPTTKAPAKTTVATKATRSAKVVAADKAAAEKVMKQAKITKLTVKSKAKKITVTWKKVKKAVGYEVEVNTNKKFKKSKSVLTKTTAQKKLVIKNKKFKSGKKYYVRVRAYATYKDANGTAIKVYSNWNKKLRKVTVK